VTHPIYDLGVHWYLNQDPNVSFPFTASSHPIYFFIFHPPMLHDFHEMYRREIERRHPDFGYPLWQPDPGEDKPVAVGDVGFIHLGRFHRLFNILLGKDDPSHRKFGVPEDHERFLPSTPDHIVRIVCYPNTLHSCGGATLSADFAQDANG
jgi:hypothetical protein